MQPGFPIEFTVSGTALSLGSSAPSRAAWKEKIKAASMSTLPEGHWLTDAPIAITLYYFLAESMVGDVDNILKSILDSLAQHIYFDDRQVERIVVQRFEPGRYFPFSDPSDVLAGAIVASKPRLYIRISTDPFEDLL